MLEKTLHVKNWFLFDDVEERVRSKIEVLEQMEFENSMYSEGFIAFDRDVTIKSRTRYNDGKIRQTVEKSDGTFETKVFDE
jgi:hypothetical protein